MSSDFTPVTVDIETSGLHPVKDFALLSIAMQNYDTGEYIYKELDLRVVGDEAGHEVFLGERADGGECLLKIAPKAMELNKLLYDTVSIGGVVQPHKGRVSRKQADEECAAFLKGIRNPKMMGLNIAGFDILYIQEYLPLTAALCNFQVIDLNTLFATQAYYKEQGFFDFRMPIQRYCEHWTYDYALQQGLHLFPHHALFDVFVESTMFAYLGKTPAEWMKRVE